VDGTRSSSSFPQEWPGGHILEKEIKMKVNGEELYHYARGMRAMLDVFIHAQHRGVSFKDAVDQVCVWHDEVLLPWKDKAEDAEQTDVFDSHDIILPVIGD